MDLDREDRTPPLARVKGVGREQQHVEYDVEYYMYICVQGRCDVAIFVITRKLGILTWDEAFLSLRSTLLSDALRAKYCELIIGSFIIPPKHIINHMLNHIGLHMILFYYSIFTITIIFEL